MQVRAGRMLGGHRVNDVRLIVLGGQLFATWHCHRCRFTVAKVHLTATTEAATNTTRHAEGYAVSLSPLLGDPPTAHTYTRVGGGGGVV